MGFRSKARESDPDRSKSLHKSHHAGPLRVSRHRLDPTSVHGRVALLLRSAKEESPSTRFTALHAELYGILSKSLKQMRESTSRTMSAWIFVNIHRRGDHEKGQRQDRKLSNFVIKRQPTFFLQTTTNFQHKNIISNSTTRRRSRTCLRSVYLIDSSLF